jgi:hypothetical protein
MPQGELEALETKDPLDILAFQYDIVCNGVELSSGAIRNHRPDIMYKAFEIAGYSREEVDTNFSGMINAFKYGAPPHGGSAPGIDRIVMLLAGEPNIREVVLFPMNQKAEDLMMNAPARSRRSSCASSTSASSSRRRDSSRRDGCQALERTRTSWPESRKMVPFPTGVTGRTVMAIDLSDYEAGAKFEGDYEDDARGAAGAALPPVRRHSSSTSARRIVCEGWDAAGKGGAIQRLTAEWDPRAFQVWPIAAPTEEEKARHFSGASGRAAGRGRDRDLRPQLVRPGAGRAGRGLRREAEWRRAYDEINEFEAQQISTARRSSSCSSTSPRGAGRAAEGPARPSLEALEGHAEDFRNRARRDDYLAAIKDMFDRRTDTRWAPWTVIDGNDKKAARIAALTAVADALAGARIWSAHCSADEATADRANIWFAAHQSRPAADRPGDQARRWSITSGTPAASRIS